MLARVLTPADFGYIAMATVITELAALFGNFGFSAVLIQRHRITRLQMDTVFWSSLAIGVILSAIVFLMSFFGQWLFKEPIAGELLRVLCVTFIINGFTVVHGALISRLMRFHIDFWIQLVPIIVRAATAIILALNGFGVWSLAGAAIADSVTRTLLYAIAIPYWPRFRFSQTYLVSTWKTNASYFGGGFLFYINSNIDLLLIGRSLGATALGYYQNARSLTDEVRSRIAVPLQRVLFPAFSSLQNDINSLQSAVLKSGRLLSAIIFPIGIGIAAVADDIVPLLYGQQWLAMIPILKFLGISIAIRGSTTIAVPIFNSQNRVGLGLRYSIISTVITIILIVLTIGKGLEAVAMAVAIASLFSFVSYRVALGLIYLGWRDLWSMIVPPGIAAATMFFVIETSRSFILTNWFLSEIYTLTWHIFIGALTYVTVAITVSPKLLSDFKSVVQTIRS